MAVPGTLIVFRVRENGTQNPFKNVACIETDTYNMDNEVAERRTKCGIITSVADPTVNITGTAVQELPLSSDHVSYKEVRAWQIAKTKLDYEYLNIAGQGLTEGEAVDNSGSGYFTSSSYNSSAEADGVGTFDFTFSGTGTPDEFDDDES
jgi:hypothetical protein